MNVADMPKITLRLPESEARYLKERAKEKRISLNSEISIRIAQSILSECRQQQGSQR
jgi:predicted HicB family RNase H-like nuclease